MSQKPLDLSRVFELEPHGPDTYVGESPSYEWGRIYGGLVIAQALWAATDTVREDHGVHSLHAYFILGGDLSEPVRYEVDRVRNGRSFSTRRVVARQSGGAILTLACSFQRAEEGPSDQSAVFPDVPRPEDLESDLDAGVELREVEAPVAPPGARAWVRFPEALGDDPRLQACGLAYLSDVNMIGAIGASSPDLIPEGSSWEESIMAASLDHAMWFHHPARADDWVLLDMAGHGLIGTRGLATGQGFDAHGTHIVTIAQEGLLRRRKRA
ncbi:MAG: acyl-CoA thioesterase [Myxococcota bacterium]